MEFADPTYTVKELKAKIARIGLKLPARRIQTMFGSGKDGRLVKKDYEKILKMYKNKAVLELIKESTTYTVKELKAKIAEMGFNKKDYILMLYITLALLKKKPRAQWAQEEQNHWALSQKPVRTNRRSLVHDLIRQT